MLNITTLCKTFNPTKNLSPLNNHPYVKRRWEPWKTKWQPM